ncbi:hypothetical protein B0T20DRAFT_492083 [Sordaria brevicollis]|uniref:RNase H type-1 domain-containing protein n=1 Tax=Sordaria brevicollis TaxID=83679 RepID=A0AAE0PK89_SORBR|nr:hypothetical protein B0T20DRAFT_492083 [Sordaria brevicollis]
MEEESEGDLTPAPAVVTYISVPDPPHFCGEIIIEKNRDKAAIVACRAHRMKPSSTDISLAFFVDGSRRTSFAGAYAVAFKRYAPGNDYHGCKIVAAWPVHYQSSNACELLAIKQALKVATLELVTLQKQLPPETKLNVRVQIFSDSMFGLEHLAGLRETMVWERKHVFLIHKWSAKLCERFASPNSLLNVKLQLIWVPGHVEEVKLHHMADGAAGIVAVSTKPLLVVDGEEKPFTQQWELLYQTLSSGQPDSSKDAQSEHKGEEDHGDHNSSDEYEFDADDYGNNEEYQFQQDGVDEQWQPDAFYGNQEVVMNDWAHQYREVQTWHFWLKEFTHCLEQLYTLMTFFSAQLHEVDVNDDMGEV